ncbi:hypothetical protein D3C86_1608530 [compost metagenome]
MVPASAVRPSPPGFNGTGRLRLHVATAELCESHIFVLDSGGFPCLAAKIEAFDERPQSDPGRIQNGGFTATVGSNQYGQMRIEVDLELSKAAIVLNAQLVEPHSFFSDFVIWPNIGNTPVRCSRVSILNVNCKNAKECRS